MAPSRMRGGEGDETAWQMSRGGLVEEAGGLKRGEAEQQPAKQPLKPTRHGSFTGAAARRYEM